MPTAVLLGTGTSNGVPTPGRIYSPDFLANPKNHRTRTSLALLGPTGNLLVDCPPELRIQLVRESIHDIEACLITHTHADHIMGMDDLRPFCLKYQSAMPVYAYPRYQEDIRRVFQYAFKEYPAGIWVPRFDLRDLPATLNVGGLSVQTFEVQHGSIPVAGLRVNNFAYMTDVNAIPDQAMSSLEGLDYLVLDAVRYEPHPNHFHFEKALVVAQEIGAKKTFLTHLSDDYDHDKVNSELPPAIELAFDGLRLEI